MNIQDAYNDWSSTYDSDHNRTRDLDERVLRENFTGRSGGLTLELGCGTGKNTRFLSHICEQVLAIDFSRVMLQNAKEKVRASNVVFCLADINRGWPIPAASVDRIACNLVLEHIADLTLIFSEVYRCLRKGGHFFISELHPFRQYQGAQANFSTASGPIAIQAFVHHVSEFLDAAKSNGLPLEDLQEWWHPDDQTKPPRIITFRFIKPE